VCARAAGPEDARTARFITLLTLGFMADRSHGHDLRRRPGRPAKAR
jgi:hypothetical protein